MPGTLNLEVEEVGFGSQLQRSQSRLMDLLGLQ